MKQKNIICFMLACTTICFVGCIQFLKNSDSGLWFYTFSEDEISSEYNLTPASFLCLQPDKTYALDFGKFEYGKWEKHADTLILHNAAGNVNAFLIKDGLSKNMKLSTEPGVTCDFEMQPYAFSGSAATPFSLQNNKWRIPATHKESAAEIKARLANHCKFWKEYFTWALDNNIETLDVRSTPTPIKIYGNGFAIKNFDDLPAEWRKCFYDSADCQIANNILEDVFMHNDIAWAHTDNKYKMFIGGFEQLEQIINKEH